ncbi:hypothetical protein GF324_00840 [bacterium]|nr:hypothetical protein [bacterium]
MTRTNLRHTVLITLVLCLPGGMLPSAFAGEADVPTGKTLHATTEPDSTDRELQFLGSPYVSANSDVGFTIGFGASFTKGRDLNLTLSTSYSTRGFMSLSLKGEVVTGGARWIREIIVGRYKRRLYAPSGWSPDPYAVATSDRLLVTLAPLWEIRGVEVGPELYMLVADSRDFEGGDGNPWMGPTPGRFRAGSAVTGGVRARWRTMSATRPMHGWLLEGAVRGGVADGETFDKPRPEFALDLRAATALRLSDAFRLYLRGQGTYFEQAPQAVQPFLGGIETLRGQSLERDVGRRVLMSRSQFHYRFAKHWAWPGELAHRIWPLVPPLKLDLELVAFHDMGAVGDPLYDGWQRTRHGYGGGLRWVIPPELVFFFDIARAPDGTLFFYFGGGETL